MERLTKTAQKQHNIHNFRRKKTLLFDLFRSYSVLSSSKNETKAEGSFHWYKSTYSWEIDGETVEAVLDFIFLGSKITAVGDCSHEIKRRLLLGRKAMTNLDSILKSTDITLLANVSLVKAMVFPVVMYGYKSWTIRKAECWRRDAFELCCWRRLLRVPWSEGIEGRR